MKFAVIKTGGKQYIVSENDEIIVEAIYGDPVGLLRLNLPHDSYIFSRGRLTQIKKGLKNKGARMIEGKPLVEDIDPSKWNCLTISEEELGVIYQHFASVIEKHKDVLAVHWMITPDVGLIFFRLDMEVCQ